jgi:starch synthase
MFIVMITPECAPAAKVGGLGDVVYGLSRELEIRGNSVEIILPKYDCMRYDQILDLQPVYNDLWVPFYNYRVHCTVYFGFVHGRKCFFIDAHSDRNFFNRGLYYGANDDPERFAFFCRAALEFMFQSGKHPDIIHCHDWQTGLVPVLLYDIYKGLGMTHPRVCYTIHNLKHQGVTGEFILHAAGLGNAAHYFHNDRMRDNFNHSALNLMKAGIVYSNFVTTVSPRYAWEIQHTDLSYGLGHTLHVHGGKFGGVLNGVDYDVWNPETDWHIPYKYGIENIESKYGDKDALRDRLWLRREFRPMVSYIGRLDHQKGVDLIRHALFYCLANGCQFVLRPGH